ncbi:MAG: isochorismatase family cysteine hydrolase, partial [Mobilitalea sp.]
MKVLVVVDMQNDFIDGTLGTKEAVGIVSSVQKKILEYRKLGYPVIFTRDSHQENYLETQEGKNLPVTHCIINTKGWEITSLLEASNSMIINKPTFGSTLLSQYIETTYPEADIELVGLCTDICVSSNAIILKAALPEQKITVDASCCAGVTPET